MHILLLTLGILILGIHVKPDAAAVSYHPALTVFRVLATVTGLPYLALSATTPLLTAWYAESFPGGSPYRLYALSNLASLLALACYPLLIEPHLSMDQQTGWWSVGFVLFAVFLRSDRVARAEAGGCFSGRSGCAITGHDQGS